MISLYLHGGYAEKPQSYKYQALIASHAPGPILYLGHANPDPVRRIQKQQQLIDRCTQLSPNLKFTIGSNHPSTLTKQLASHQIWVLGGGEVQRLLDVFTKLELK